MRSAFAEMRTAFSVLAGALATANAAFGPYMSTGPTASGIYISSSTATLVVPNPPSGSDGDLSLWVGMGTSNGDLVQSIVENWYGDSTWSTYAYTLEETSSDSQTPVQGPSASLSAGAEVKMVYQYSESTDDYTQTVYLNGVVVSTLSTSDGYAEGWGSAVECAATNCGTVPQHQWLDIQIVLSGADPGYVDTFGLGGGAEATISTPDGGITWNVGTLTIPEFDFTTGDSSPITSSGSSTATTTTKAAGTSTTTTAKATTTTSSSSSGTQSLYGQCGGIGWTGPTVCASGSTCQYDNAYYSQCVA